MIYQICAHGIVLVHRKRDFQFRSNAINAGDKNWITHSGKIRSKQAAEAADFSKDLRPVSFLHKRLNLVLQSIAEIDIDARARVSLFHNVTL